MTGTARPASFARMWNGLIDQGDLGIEVLHAYAVKENLRALLALAPSDAGNDVLGFESSLFRGSLDCGSTRPVGAVLILTAHDIQIVFQQLLLQLRHMSFTVLRWSELALGRVRGRHANGLSAYSAGSHHPC